MADTSQPKQLTLKGSEIRDITAPKEAIKSLNFTQEELRGFLASNGDARYSFSDIESTGLGARSHGVTQFSSAKAVAGEKDGDARMELLNVYMLPTKPIFHEYQLAAKWAQEHGKAPPAYNHRLYEYDVDEAALRVTGTKYRRDRDDGPITGMQIEVKDDAGAITKVKTIEEPCESFYRAIPEIEAFIVKDHDLYYNAPFDKPFLREKWLDALAYQHYVQQNPDEERRADALYNNPEAVASDIAKLRSELEKEAETSAALAFLGDSNHWQCLLHGYMAARPSQPSNTLDASFTNLVDSEFEGRKEHDAAEDIAMSAKVAAKLMGADHFNGDIPTFAQLYERVIQRTIPDAQVKADAPYNMPYYADNDVKKRLDSDYGHLHITIPRDKEGKLDDHAAALHDFYVDFDETYRRNTGSPQHIVEMREVNGAVEILVNTNRSKPLSINLLKKLLFFEDAIQMKDRVEAGAAPIHIERINWFDSTAKVDVQLEKDGKVIEDVPLRSLQINLKFLREHCAGAQERGEYLELIKQVTQRKAASQLYLSYDEETQQTHFQIKGNLRGGGVIDIAIPKDEHPLDYGFDVMQQLDRLLKMGALFGVESSQRSFEEEEPEGYDMRGRKEAEGLTFGTSVTLEGRKNEEGDTLSPPPFSLTLSSALGQMVWSHYHHNDPSNDAAITIGEGAQLTRDDEGRVQFTGELDEAFARHPLDIEKEGATKETAEFSRVLADCSWLAYRLEAIPGVSDVTIQADHSGALIFPNGVSTKALMVLHEARVPFSISLSDNNSAPTRITLDMDALMVDAFEYSRDLSRATKDIKVFFSGDPEKLRELNKEKKAKYMRYETDIARLSAALYAGDIAALEMNSKGEMRFSTKRDMADAAQHETPPLRHKFQNLGQDHKGDKLGLRIVTDGDALRVDQSTIKAPLDVPLEVQLKPEENQAIITLLAPMARWMQAMTQGVEGVKVEDITASNATIAKWKFTLDTRQEAHSQLLTKLSALSECYYYLSMIHSQPRFSFTRQKQWQNQAGEQVRALRWGDEALPSLTLTPYGANLTDKAAALYATLDQIRNDLDGNKQSLDTAVREMHGLLVPEMSQGHEAFNTGMRRSLPRAKALDALMALKIEDRFVVMDRITHRCDEVKGALKEYHHLCISFTDEIEKLRGELQELPEAQRSQQNVSEKLTVLNAMHDDVQRMHNAMERMEEAAGTLKAQCYDKQRTNGLARRFIDLELAHLSETVAARVDSVLQSEPKDADAAIKKSLTKWREMMTEEIIHAATNPDHKIVRKKDNKRLETKEERDARRTKEAKNEILGQAVLREIIALLAQDDVIPDDTALTNKRIASELLQHLVPELPLDKKSAQDLVVLCDLKGEEAAKQDAEARLFEHCKGKKQINFAGDMIRATMLASGYRSEQELAAACEHAEINKLGTKEKTNNGEPNEAGWRKVHKNVKATMKRVRALVPDPHRELKAMRALLNKIGNEDEGVIKELNDFERIMLHGVRHMNQALAMLYAEPDVLEAAQGAQSTIKAHQTKWAQAHQASDALLEEGKRTAQQNLEALGLVAANDNLPDSFTIDMEEIVKVPETWAQKLREVLVKPPLSTQVTVEEQTPSSDHAGKSPDTPVQDLPLTPEIEAIEQGILETIKYLKKHPELANLSGIMLSIPLNVPETYREIYKTSVMQLINETTLSFHPEWAEMARCELNEKGELILHAAPAIMPHLLKGLLHHKTALEHLAQDPRAAAPEAPDASDALLGHDESDHAEILTFPEMNSMDYGEPVPHVEAGEHQGLAKLDAPGRCYNS